MVAILNIQIPQIMSGVINVVAKYRETKDSEKFLEEMLNPSIRLVSLYLAQVSYENVENFSTIILII